MPSKLDLAVATYRSFTLVAVVGKSTKKATKGKNEIGFAALVPIDVHLEGLALSADVAIVRRLAGLVVGAVKPLDVGLACLIFFDVGLKEHDVQKHGEQQLAMSGDFVCDFISLVDFKPQSIL